MKYIAPTASQRNNKINKQIMTIRPRLVLPLPQVQQVETPTLPRSLRRTFAIMILVYTTQVSRWGIYTTAPRSRLTKSHTMSLYTRTNSSQAGLSRHMYILKTHGQRHTACLSRSISFFHLLPLLPFLFYII
jgi:hypothetical protein